MQRSHQVLTVLSVSVATAISAFSADPDAAGVEFFETKIRPVLVESCYECHSVGAEVVQGGLLLDSRDGMLRGGDSGAAMVPRNLDESLVLSSLKYDSFEMPPSGPLSKQVIADFEKWIEMGAPDPRDKPSSPGPTVAKPAIDFVEAKKFWSFQQPARHDPPEVVAADRVNGPIDAFVIAQLEQAGLSPNDRADRVTLLRRLNFAVLGLPPTADQIDQFVSDSSPEAWQKQVDRVLASPHYGERVGRLWLDLMRYAEDQAHIVGDNQSLTYPNAYLYRDWVIGALNDDMPYDEFVKRQLAADKLEPDNLDAHVALGFLGLGPKYYRRNAPEVMAEEWENHVDTVTRGILGLTVACARCHDHKYDPIPTTDYYALAGVFASTELYNRPIPELVETLPPDATEKQRKQKENERKNKAPSDSVHLVRDKNPQDIHVQIRGDYRNKGPHVERAFLTVLSEEEPPRFDEGSGRLQLAEALVARDNPLAARVIVNRVWAHLFGMPLVETPSNFGALGDRPSHPQLLDDLSVRFMENGWSLKWLSREILLSSTWQQSSEIIEAKETIDPTNSLIWRMNRRRLDVEAWRDTLLTVSGRLDSTIGGPSLDPQDPASKRRTIYAEVSRLEVNKMLALFDFPDPNVHAASRSNTTTPLQKMFVLNSPFVLAQAAALADQCMKAGDDDLARVHWVYRHLFGRAADPAEIEIATSFLGHDTTNQADRWTQFAQVLLASNEMLVID